MTTKRRRLRGSLRQQRQVEKEYRKKYGSQVLEGRRGGVLPPTIWNYRRALLFSSAGSQDRGVEESLTTRVGHGNYRTNVAHSSDDNH